MKWFGTGVGTNETVWCSNSTVNSNLLHFYLINIVLNSHPRFRILDNQNDNFPVVSIFTCIFKEGNGMIWYFLKRYQYH